MMRYLPILATALLAAGCAGGKLSAPDPEVLIRMVGHWVDRDLGIATATGIAIKVQQQPEDGALYIMRDDGARRMMVENIFCARPDDWQATVGQIDLSVVRMARPKEVRVSCALPPSGGRVICTEPEL